jgi:hypothetical protein
MVGNCGNVLQSFFIFQCFFKRNIFDKIFCFDFFSKFGKKIAQKSIYKICIHD